MGEYGPAHAYLGYRIKDEVVWAKIESLYGEKYRSAADWSDLSTDDLEPILRSLLSNASTVESRVYKLNLKLASKSEIPALTKYFAIDELDHNWIQSLLENAWIRDQSIQLEKILPAHIAANIYQLPMLCKDTNCHNFAKRFYSSSVSEGYLDHTREWPRIKGNEKFIGFLDEVDIIFGDRISEIYPKPQNLEFLKLQNQDVNLNHSAIYVVGDWVLQKGSYNQSHPYTFFPLSKIRNTGALAIFQPKDAYRKCRKSLSINLD